VFKIFSNPCRLDAFDVKPDQLEVEAGDNVRPAFVIAKHHDSAMLRRLPLNRCGHCAEPVWRLALDADYLCCLVHAFAPPREMSFRVLIFWTARHPALSVCPPGARRIKSGSASSTTSKLQAILGSRT